MKRLLLFIPAFSLLTTVTAQTKVYLPYVDVVNISNDYRISVTRLFRTYLENTGRYRVIMPATVDTSQTFDNIESTIETAMEAGASQLIRGELNKVGETVIITFRLYSVSRGDIIWFDLLKASGAEDIDPVLLKIARNIGTSKKASLEKDVTTVFEHDAKEIRRMYNYTYLGLMLGGAVPFIRDNNVLGSGFGGALTFDAREIIFDITGEMYFSNYDMYLISLNANYPFLKHRHTPYAGGGLGWGISNLDYNFRQPDPLNILDETNDRIRGYGLILFANAGEYFNRNSTIGLRVNFRFFYSLFELNEHKRLLSMSGNQQKRTLRYPLGIMFNLALLFGG